MTSSGILRSRAARWLAPVGVVAVVAVGITVSEGVAGAAPSLPEKTAAELLASVAQAAPQPFSGTVEESTDLGLPSLPGTSSASLSWQSLLTGTHTARVWVASPQQVRLSLIGDLAESDVVRNGPDVWIWSSSDRTVDHLVLPDRSAASGAAPTPTPSMPALDPTALAQRALAAIDPTTSVTVSGTAEVAGRPVYELVLAPKGAGSLIASVRISLDSQTYLPLKVQVLAIGQESPAVQSAFTSISFATPDPSVFAFTPPPGATVTEHTLPAKGSRPSGSVPSATPGLGDGVHVLGSGWTSVLSVDGAAPLLARASSGAPGGTGISGTSGASLDAVLNAATPVTGTFGTGRLLQTSLLSVLLLDDGRVLVGAVTPSVLEQAASSGR